MRGLPITLLCLKVTGTHDLYSYSEFSISIKNPALGTSWLGRIPDHFTDFSCGWPGLQAQGVARLGSGVVFSFIKPVKNQQRLQLSNIYLGALHWGHPSDSEHEMKHRCRS